MKNLQNKLTKLEYAIEGSFEHYEKIESHGEFYKFSRSMDYTSGELACMKISGHIVEFDEKTSKGKHLILKAFFYKFDQFDMHFLSFPNM